MMISIAGVLANMILVIIGIAVAKILMLSGWTANDFFSKDASPIVVFVSKLMFLNLSLAVFNLIPIPPLDGGKILSNFVPDSVKPILDLIEQFGFMLLLLMVWMGLFNAIIRPFAIALFNIIHSI